MEIQCACAKCRWYHMYSRCVLPAVVESRIGLRGGKTDLDTDGNGQDGRNFPLHDTACC